MEHTPKMSQLKWYKLYLLLIIIFGFGLRIYHIGGESIWADEGWSFYYAQMSIGALLNDVFFNENNPPLYYVFLHVWIKIAGESEMAMRLPSAVFGALLIYCIFRIGQLLYDKTTGLWCAFISAVSLFFIEYSQEARAYMLFALLSCLSMKSYIEIQKGSRTLKYAEYILWTVLLLYSHVYSVFFVLAQNIIFGCQRYVFQKRDGLGLKGWIYLQGAVFLLACPWFVSYLIRAQDIQDNFWLTPPTLTELKRTFTTFAQKSSLGLKFFFLLAVFAILKLKYQPPGKQVNGILERINGLKWEIKIQKVEESSFLAIWALVPIIVPFILSWVSQPVYHVRYTIGSAIPFYLLVAAGLKHVSMNSKIIKISLTSILLMLSIGNAIGYYQNIRKDQFREAFAYIEEKSEPGDLVIMNSRAIYWTTYSYYKNRDDLRAIGFPQDDRRVPMDNSKYVRPEHLPELRKVTAGHSRIWVVLAYSGDRERLIIGYLNNHYSLVNTPSFRGLELYEFVKN